MSEEERKAKVVAFRTQLWGCLNIARRHYRPYEINEWARYLLANQPGLASELVQSSAVPAPPVLSSSDSW